ncbi:cupin domain-containing protein [Mucilaginibacter ginsenosidivorans]|uniref:Cupin domain-containing protein n=1 Tax=Mucilaginibacter ginsenosidivorans TaxID=398053 RepID=A0A5B8USX6_9SPHI|nr:cupin domain-containing protein [Mucilaginibacter ginsenosidivorans]QEC62104.1 cupin domain-containing protein [Mucilaginibacter ginsenosidivorans]
MKNLLGMLLVNLFLLYLTPVHVNAQTRPDSSSSQRTGQSPVRSFFSGGTATVVRMTMPPGLNCGAAKVTFQPGARTIWHAHAGGQVIVVTSGTAWYQEKGKPKQIIKQGEAVVCPPGVMHWHGASPDGPMTHIVTTPNLDRGGVTAGAVVTDQEYMEH